MWYTINGVLHRILHNSVMAMTEGGLTGIDNGYENVSQASPESRCPYFRLFTEVSNIGLSGRLTKNNLDKNDNLLKK